MKVFAQLKKSIFRS